MHLFSWNVNGIRAAQRKGFLDWVSKDRPDVICVQETKAQPDQLDQALLEPDGYRSYWASAERKGYSGVALYTRIEPRNVRVGLGIEEFDREGRTILADYEDYVLLTTYVPNGSRDHSRVPFKMAYKKALLDTCNALRSEGRSVIVCGDINTAHREIDLARPKQNQTSTGFLPIEREWIDTVVEQGYIDTFRQQHPERAAYSWWAYWGGARERDVGWRLDYFFVTADLSERIVSAEIHPNVFGSDHCPVSLKLR